MYTNNHHVNAWFRCGVDREYIQILRDNITKYQFIGNKVCVLTMGIPSDENKLTIASNGNRGENGDIVDIATFSKDKIQLDATEIKANIDGEPAYLVKVPKKDTTTEGVMTGAASGILYDVRSVPINGIIGIALKCSSLYLVPSIDGVPLVRTETITAGTSIEYKLGRIQKLNVAKYNGSTLEAGTLLCSGTYVFLNDVYLDSTVREYSYALVMRTA